VKRTAFALALILVACSTRSPRVGGTSPRSVPFDADRHIRISLAAPDPRVSATRDFAWYAGDGRTVLARGRAGDEWRLEFGGAAQVRAVRAGTSTAWQREMVLRPGDNGFVTVNGKRYRGELLVVPWAPDTAPPVPLIVNRLPVEEYLRGVVPLEMGNRPRGDSAALQAQAVASRSYAHVRLGGRGVFDLRSTVADQVYGGVDAENPLADAAVLATRGLVLRYQGRIVDALYSSTCGGSTAEPTEVWRTTSVPYLKRVSDRVEGSTRYYCESAPRYRWTRTLSRSELQAALDRYLAFYASVPENTPGHPRHIAVVSHTPSGRVATLEIETDRGAFPLRGNDIRYVLRAPGSEILSSTYFSVEPEYGRDGLITRVTFRGRGYGHGVGMCQWGAIGRARAGQSFRSILGTYYPGTTVGLPVQ
jgi:stage II sporulation protein D